MRVLVTGAAGFLGRHVAAHLVRLGFAVTGFDVNEHPRVRTVIGDLRDEGAVRAAIAGHDVVCHIGAVGDVYLAAHEPALAAAVNVTGSVNVAEGAARAGARVVYASTWEVYGAPQYEPLDEDHPCRPDHPYNVTKLAGEQMLLAADRLRGVPVLSLRLGTAYGTGLRPNSVIRLFVDRARAGEPITILGDGSQARQFTHVRDLARAFALACTSDVHGVALNVVAPEPVTIKELAETVVARHPTTITFAEARPGDVAPALVSSRRAAETLEWRPEVSFQDGIAELLESG